MFKINNKDTIVFWTYFAPIIAFLSLILRLYLCAVSEEYLLEMGLSDTNFVKFFWGDID